MKPGQAGTPRKAPSQMGGKRDNAWTTLQELEDLGEEREDLDEELDDALLDLIEHARVASDSLDRLWQIRLRRPRRKLYRIRPAKPRNGTGNTLMERSAPPGEILERIGPSGVLEGRRRCWRCAKNSRLLGSPENIIPN